MTFENPSKRSEYRMELFVATWIKSLNLMAVEPRSKAMEAVAEFDRQFPADKQREDLAPLA